MKPMTNVSNEPVSRQLAAFANDRLCASCLLNKGFTPAKLDIVLFTLKDAC
jgi:hypothetical protein